MRSVLQAMGRSVGGLHVAGCKAIVAAHDKLVRPSARATPGQRALPPDGAPIVRGDDRARKETVVKALQHYVGRLVHIRPAVFDALLSAARRRGAEVENSFVVAAALNARNKLICCGAERCLLVSPADVSLV